MIPGLNRYADWEAMAKDGDNFYLVGSKGLLFRFRLNEQEKDWSKIQVTEAKEIVINNFDLVKTELKGRKPEIEGLAIYANDQKKELVVGIREHDSAGKPRTGAIHFYRAEIMEQGLTLKPFFKFDATDPAVLGAADLAWHLSSIEHVPDWSGFLVMTTTERKDRYYGSILWFVPEDQLKQNPNEQTFRSVVPTRSKVFQESLPGGRPGIKAEGLAVLSDGDSKRSKQTLSVVIVFDNDSRAPSALMFVELSKPPSATDRSGF